MVPSTVDPDAAGYAERANKAKKPVKISARSLAKLDRNEVMKAAAKARASSSILRPIDARRGHEVDLSSSGNASVRSSMSVDYSGTKESRNEMRLSPLQNSYPQSLASQDDYETGTQSASSLSSPVHIHKLASHSQFHAAPHPPPPPEMSVKIASRSQFHAAPHPPPPREMSVKIASRSQFHAAPHPAPPPEMSVRIASRSQFHAAPHPPPPPERSVKGIVRPPVPTTQITNPMFQSATSYVRENRRASVVWDQEAGRYVSVPAQTRTGAGVELQSRTPWFLANPTGESSNNGKNLAPANTSSSAMSSGQPAERLTYTGQSIFFGGPILSTPGINAQRNEAGTRARPEGGRDSNAHQRDTQGERVLTGSLPVFAPGTVQRNPPFDK